MNPGNSIFFKIVKRKETPLFLILIITSLGLFGWVFGKSIFTTFSLKYIPIAPSSTIIFIVLSLLFLLKINSDKSRTSQTLGLVSLIAIGLFCLLIFLDHIFNLPWDIEKFFISNPDRFWNVLQGRMSPISSILFIFICIGIWGIRKATSEYIKYTSGLVSLAVLLIASVLLIGYLYKAPLLYGSQIIPVALPTAICFLLFSTSLLLTIELKYWTFNLIRDNTITRQLLRYFLPIVVLIVVFQGFLITNLTIHDENPTLTSAFVLLIVTVITVMAVIRVSAILGTQILKVENDLRNSETRLQTLVQTIPDLVWLKDTDGIYLSCNAMFERLYGSTEVNIIGKTDYDFVSAELGDFFRKNDRRAMEAGKPIINEEMVTFADDGHQAILETIKTPMYDSAGTMIGVLGIGRDITARKLAEEDLMKAKEKAEESDRLKSAFLANMSHEIRTPMNGILGFAELLKEPKLTGEEQKEYIRIIEKSGARMLNIINDIINISKVESGQMPVYLSIVNVNDQIEFIHNFFKPEAEQKGVKLLYKIPSPTMECNIETDREKVYAVLTNLVKNAIKFTWDGSIELGYERKDGHLEFYVKDTGNGIHQEQKELIFERFRQGSESLTRNYEGAGLGLSISKAYVEMLGGRIWVESEIGKGAQFYFTLPYNNKMPEKSSAEKVDSTDAMEDKIKKLKILIAEDDELSALYLTKVIKRYSREILKVRTGVEVVEICHKYPDIDLILMDIRMPEMDGYHATERIRKFNKDVIIIAQTAFALAGDRDKAIACGCNDYISKPVNQASLNELINKFFADIEKG